MSKIRRLLNMGKGDTIVTAYPQSVAGPDWANIPLWVIVRDGDGILREECLQPDEQTVDIRMLFTVCEATHGAMLSAVERGVAR